MAWRNLRCSEKDGFESKKYAYRICKGINTDQNLQHQIDALNEAGCKRYLRKNIRRQQETKTVAGSPQLYAWRRYACGLEISRLTRSLTQLISTVKDLEEWQIGLKVITQNIDISTPEGGLFFHMNAAFDQFERKIIVKNTRAGLNGPQKWPDW